MSETNLIFFWLMVLATMVAMLGRFIRIPHTIALVFTGFGVGFLGLLPGAHLNPHLLFAIFLPPILFDAGINTNLNILKRQWLSISVFAVLGTIISTFVVGWAVHYLTGIPILVGLLFGAIISPTDPISVLAIFKSLGIDEKLSSLIEAESLFNDGVAVVLFLIIQQLLLNSGVSVIEGGLEFIKTVMGGAMIGLLIGALASRITSKYDDHLLEIMLTTVVAFGAYLAAEQIHVSGVFAVVSASLVVGNYGMTHGMTPNSRMAVLSFWEYIAFAVNSMVFLLVGLEESSIPLGAALTPIIIAIAAVLLGRVVSVYGLSSLLNLAGQVIPMSWRHVQVWSGLRGALSMAMVIGLDPSMPYRNLLISMTFAVVLFSLVGQGLSIKALVLRLGLSKS